MRRPCLCPRVCAVPPAPRTVRPGVLLSVRLVLGPKGGLYFQRGLTFGSVHFAATLPFPTPNMSEPMLLYDLQLEENDTIDEVESSDDSDLEVVEAPVNDVEQQVRAAIDARARQEAVDVPEEAPIRLPPFKATNKQITLLVSISVHILRMIVDCVSGARPKCVAALHRPLGGLTFGTVGPGSRGLTFEGGGYFRVGIYCGGRPPVMGMGTAVPWGGGVVPLGGGGRQCLGGGGGSALGGGDGSALGGGDGSALGGGDGSALGWGGAAMPWGGGAAVPLGGGGGRQCLGGGAADTCTYHLYLECDSLLLFQTERRLWYH